MTSDPGIYWTADQEQLLVEFTSLYETRLSPLARPEYRNVGWLLEPWLNETCVYHALRAFVCTSVATKSEQSMRCRGLDHYQTAIAEIRARVSQNEQADGLEAVVIATSFLGQTEVSRLAARHRLITDADLL